MAGQQSQANTESQRFPKHARLRKRREFLALKGSGTTFHGRHFLAVIAPRSSTATTPETLRGRLGITVSKKVGNAVVRNRIKRLVREHMRRHSWIPAGADAVVIAKRGAGSVTGLAEVAADLKRIGKRVERQWPGC